MSNFEHAVGLDPRNILYLMTAGNSYNSLHRYSEASRLHERALSISPHDDYWVRIEHAFPPLHERAEIRPLRRELDAIRAEAPEAAPGISSVLFQCAVFERDSAAANRALAVMPPEGTSTTASTNFNFPREWFAGLAARTFNDPEAARAAFTAARGIAEKIVSDQPDYAPAWSLLGRIDAALGRKEEAVKEGRRACELLPISKDAWAGPYYVKDLATIYAWTGQSDLALEQLALLASKGLHYGELKLDPQWDALRPDPRFDELLASYAPKNISR
jgi:tetratricopeptide (TPR) repeat protein